MKALSLTQPWASLVAMRQKRVETRSWSTKYVGPLAIHAAKCFPSWAKRELAYEPFNVVSPVNIPLGKIICIVNLLGCRKTEDVRVQLTTTEVIFGDYSDGRYAWFFEYVELLKEPVPAIGHSGLWDWERP